ncbi:MAG: hypothetical protein KDK90_14460 [Leptospiraceae bacterium]|nr:hypothetical protein [Leptospiraceae bacterium]
MEEISGIIASAVQQQSITAKEVASNVSQTSLAASEITKNISGINQASKDGAKEAISVLSQSNSLHKLAEDLNGIVGQFKIK